MTSHTDKSKNNTRIAMQLNPEQGLVLEIEENKDFDVVFGHWEKIFTQIEKTFGKKKKSTPHNDVT